MNKSIPIGAMMLAGITASAQDSYFSKITQGPIVTTDGDSRSVNWVDVNNDGFTDCFISNGPHEGQNNMLYMNNGDGNFTAVVNDTIVKDRAPSDGATFADMDNDGDLDAFVVNWYNVNNLLYTNDGFGHFTRISTGNPVNDAGYSETASWGDYDKDGKADLYVCNSAGDKRNFLYRNNGSGDFDRIITGSIVTDTRFSRCINWVDIDNDGDADAFVTNEENQDENIYRNDGGGSFTSLTAGPLLGNGGHTMSGSWADYDNDGDLDVFLANDRSCNALFRNDGDFNFVKAVTDTVSTTPSNSFSSAWSDIDNDGDLDLFVTNAFLASGMLTNFLYINNGNGTFSRNSTDPCTADSAWSYGCAFGDYDNDGFEDLAVATCRFGGTDRPDFLYHNEGNNNHWLTLTLKGTTGNASAIGARVYVKAAIQGTPVWQMRELSAQSAYCGQNDLRAHFGLGDAAMADSIKIVWPMGLIEYYTQVAADDFITYVEGPVTGIREQDETPGMVVYPNPATSWLTITPPSGFSHGDQVSIKTIDGRTLFQKPTGTSGQITIDTSKHAIAPGMYLLEIQHGNRLWVRHLVIQ